MVAQSEETLKIEQQIIAAADNMIAVHDEWERDEKAPIQPTAAFEEALVKLAETCNGDIPSRCRELATAVSRLTEEWNQYARGEWDRRGCPLPRFWGAFRNFLTARSGATIRPIRRPEPVAALLEQKVSYQQIAFHIWGHDGKGPFINEAGQPDIDRIRQAADGTYKGHLDWIHPSELSRNISDTVASKNRIENVLRLEHEDEQITEDKSSIEDLLREGQFASVIAQVKHCTIEEVYRVGQAKGLTVNERPNLTAERSPYEPEIPESIHRAMPSNPVEQRTPQAIQTTMTPETLNMEITRMLGEGIGAPEIARELGVTPQKVAAVHRENKKKSTVAVQAVFDDGDDVDDEEDDSDE